MKGLAVYVAGLSLFFSFHGCSKAHAEEGYFTSLTKQDIALQVVYTGLHLVDYKQTMDIKNHRWRDMYETNKFLGRHPSDSRIRNYFLLTGTLHLGVTYMLPREYRSYWQGSTIGLVVWQIDRNKRLGLNVRF